MEMVDVRYNYQKCSNGFEMCSVWYDKFNGIEEEVLGVGAMMIDPRRQLTKELVDELFQEDMRDY